MCGGVCGWWGRKRLKHGSGPWAIDGQVGGQDSSEDPCTYSGDRGERAGESGCSLLSNSTVSG